MSVRSTVHLFLLSTAALGAFATQAADFHLQEATIDGVQGAIRAGQTTCKQVVESYVARAKAYNGSCTKLVTLDGAKLPAAFGAVRAGSPIKFPTETLAITQLVPDYDKYKGLKPDFGRMEPTMSDPSVKQQYGMVTSIPNMGQLNTLEVLNIR